MRACQTTQRYTLTELADLAGVTPRTVRYYIGQGLLPSVGQSGPGAKYGDDHLARLRLIRRLQREHLPLAEIRRRLDRLDDAEIAELAGRRHRHRRPIRRWSTSATILGRHDANAAPDPRGRHRLLRRISPGPAAPMVAPRRQTDSTPRIGGHLKSSNLTPPRPRRAHRRLVRSDGRDGPRRPGDRRHRPLAVGADRPGAGCRTPRPSAADRSPEQAVDRLVTIARELLEEDPS